MRSMKVAAISSWKMKIWRFLPRSCFKKASYVCFYTLKDRVTDVEKKSKPKSESIEPNLPGVGVDPCEDGRHDEQEDVDDQGRVDSWLCAKFMSK